MTCLKIVSCALICCHESTCLLKVYAFEARVYIGTFYSNQTILQFCENWIHDNSTLKMFFPATADATSSNETSLEK